MPRDKFAAMASRAAANEGDSNKEEEAKAAGADTGAEDTATTAADNTDTAVAADSTAVSNPPQQTQQPARRDKLAALSARSNSPVRGGNSKLAAMAQKQEDVKMEDAAPSPEEAAKKKEAYLKKLQSRLKKRNALLDRLDKAEDLTCDLLKVAAQTMEALQDVNGPGSSEASLSKLSSIYQQTIQEIHPLITGEGGNGNDAMKTEDGIQESNQALVKAYQNHSQETKQSMYAARVEMRLAKDRADILRDFVALEKNENVKKQEATTKAGQKRGRDE